MDILEKTIFSNKAGRKLLLNIILAVVLLLSSSSGALSATIYVPDDYGDIQTAVNNAVNGDTVIIRDGIYTENIKVNKSITIKSENGTQNCTVKALNPNKAVFSIESNSVNVSGITVSGAATKEGIYITADNCNVSSNDIKSNYCGVKLYHSSNNIIRDNILSENSYGIYSYCSDDNLLQDNYILYNEEGVNLLNSRNNLIDNNNVSFNTYGIIVSSSNHNAVSNNILTKNKHSLEIDTSKENTIIKNIISLNVNGIRLEFSDNNSIFDNIISSNSEKGIYLFISLFNQLYNNSAINCTEGFYLLNSSHNIVKENRAESNSIGIQLKNTVNTSIVKNYALNNREGLLLVESSNANTTGNLANSNKKGIHLINMSNSTLTENIALKNSLNFIISGAKDLHFNNTIKKDNLVDRKPVYYIKNAYNLTLNGSTNAGVFYCIWCENVTVKDLLMANNSESVFFWKSNDSKLMNVTTSNSLKGIYFYQSFNNTVEGNDVSSNDFGIYLEKSSKNEINSTRIYNNINGMHLAQSCSNNVTNCEFTENDVGFYVEMSSSNVFYLNTFKNNTMEVDEGAVSGPNNFNSTFPIYYSYNGSVFKDKLGNRWDNYTGFDNDSNGIGDTPYTISSEKDYYPLTNKTSFFKILDKADLTIIEMNIPVLKAGETGNISLRVVNQGYANSPDFNVSLSSNGQEISRIGISLKIGEEQTLNFTWSPEEGSYIIKGVIDPDNRIGESNETNNQISKNTTVEKPPQPSSTPQTTESPKRSGSSSGPLKPLPPPFELNHSYYDSYSTYLMKGHLKKINSHSKIGKLEVYEIGLLNDISLPATVFISEIDQFPDYIGEPGGTFNYSFELIVTRYPTQQKIEPYGYLKFRIPTKFIEENKINPLNVNLTRYTNGKWVEIPREYMGGDENYHYYSADLNFSCIFSITALEKSEEISETNYTATNTTATAIAQEENSNLQLQPTPLINGSIAGYVNQNPWWKHTTSLIALFAGVLATTGLTIYFSRLRRRGKLG